MGLIGLIRRIGHMESYCFYSLKLKRRRHENIQKYSSHFDGRAIGRGL